MPLGNAVRCEVAASSVPTSAVWVLLASYSDDLMRTSYRIKISISLPYPDSLGTDGTYLNVNKNNT